MKPAFRRAVRGATLVLQLGRPLAVRVELDPGLARQARLDLLQVLLQQLGCNARLHAEHQLLAFAGGFDRLGRELGRTGHERHLRAGITNWGARRARCAPRAQRHAAGHRSRAEEVMTSDRSTRFSTLPPAPAPRWLGQAELHAAVARCLSAGCRRFPPGCAPAWHRWPGPGTARW